MIQELLAFFMQPLNYPLAHALLFLMSFYVLFECVVAAEKMNRGDRLCRLFKYIFTMLAGLIGVVFALSGFSMPLIFIFIFALDLFLWPAMVYRFRGEYRNRVNDK